MYTGPLILILDARSMEPLAVAENGVQAAHMTGVSHCNVAGYCNGRYKKTRTGFTFRYMESLKEKRSA